MRLQVMGEGKLRTDLLLFQICCKCKPGDGDGSAGQCCEKLLF